ncbi:MAG: translation initiation factor IF-3 [Clostridia bacterium]
MTYKMWYFATFFLWRFTTINELQINDQIREKEVRLIASNGAQLGIVTRFKAQQLAEEEGLDLVMISPKAVPPVCKILDYSKYKYEQSKKDKEMRKNQKVTELKIIWLSMTISEADMQTKAKAAQRWLVEGDKVKVSLKMIGRQQAYTLRAIEVVKKFYQILSPVSKIEKIPLAEGRNVTMVLAPLTSK